MIDGLLKCNDVMIFNLPGSSFIVLNFKEVSLTLVIMNYVLTLRINF